ncbi:flagellar basal body rod protein FlgC [Prosthecomicrobium sp. N25]|uniref:flagellar basal body rod protein FlgC n=1 Tax=Prosthecomicrobium sp. N25 TaxID=3129254 RepID=UPI003076DF48
MSLSAIATAVSGMNAAARRLEVSASNVANARTTGTVPDANGATTAYRPQDVRQQAVAGGGVTTTVTTRPNGVGLAYDPTSPDADARGMVGAPEVDYAGEAITQLTAKLDYEAALKVVKVADEMMKSTLDLTA